MLYDAHIHVGMFPSIQKTVQSAIDANITFVAVGIYLEESLKTIKAMQSLNTNMPVFVGIHPWYASDHVFDENLIEDLVQSPCVQGIGECGLDNQIDLPLNYQIELLEKHLDIASKYHLCVNLHIRGYHNELIAILKKYSGKVTGIIHNATFSYELAKRYVDLGMSLSVGHFILRPSDKLQNVISKIGLKHICLETDSDYLHTGEYDPTLLKKEYESLGSLLGITTDTIELELENNLQRIIGIN